MPTAGEELICASGDFNFSVNAGYLEARVSMPEMAEVQVGSTVTLDGTYTKGRPNILDIPFIAEVVQAPAATHHVNAEIVSINPQQPDFSGGVDEEQPVSVTVRVPGTPDPNANTTRSVLIELQTYQPGRDSDDRTEQVFIPPGNVISNPILYAAINLTYANFGESIVVEWDYKDENGQPKPLDVRVSVISPLYGVQGVQDYFNRLTENLTITYNFLVSILTIGTLDPDEEAEIKFQVKEPGGIFNRDDLEINFSFPFRRDFVNVPSPRNMEFGLASDPDRPGFQIYRLQWEQPYWSGDPNSGDFTNYWKPVYLAGTFPPQLDPSNRQLDIDAFEFRYKRDTEPFSDWRTVSNTIQTIARQNQPTESVLVIARDYPFGQHVPTAGEYTFEGRARLLNGTYGGRINTTATIP